MSRAPFLVSGKARHGLPPTYPVRAGNRITPLLLAAEMYPALERLIAAAQSSVWMAFRIFDPTLRLRSEEGRARGRTWGELLVDATARGVHIRVLLTDFEPTVADELHARSWAARRTLMEAARGLDPAAAARLELLIAPHEGEMAWGARQIFRLPVGIAIRRTLAKLQGHGDGFETAIADRPGLWRHYRMVDGRPRFRRGPAPRLWPATHHHKFAVVDGRIAIVGGLDLDERRWDTPGHRRPAQETWRDLSAMIEGPAVADCAHHFSQLWNRDAARVEAIQRYWCDGIERTLDCRPAKPIPEAALGPAPPPTGEARVQMVRTWSKRSPSLWAIGPRPAVREIRQAVRRLILAARTCLYIETQFLRELRVARWIVLAARRSPGLRVIIVLPQAPDDVAFAGHGDHPAHAHGEWLQARALGLLRRRLGDRLGVYALARDRSLAQEEQGLDEAAHAAGAGIVYVHSKLLIADDRLALVSSANLNGRSLSWDTEFGFLWEEPDAVGRLRRRAWAGLFDEPPEAVPTLDEAGDAWRERAIRNLARRPEDRQGFVLPYNVQRVRRAGRRSLFVPDDLV